jgi:hypothetical protein
MAAIGLAAALLERRDPHAVMGSFAADHVITDPDGFGDAVRTAVAVAREDWLVTLGIEPTFPSSAFGYIRSGDGLDGHPGAQRVAAFVEKPSVEVATGYLAEAAVLGVPVLLDGLMSVACALLADRLAPGAAQWFAAGHRSTEPAQSLALEKLGLEPLLDLGLRLGEGSGAVAAVPLVRSAAALLRDTALLSEVLP